MPLADTEVTRRPWARSSERTALIVPAVGPNRRANAPGARYWRYVGELRSPTWAMNCWRAELSRGSSTPAPAAGAVAATWPTALSPCGTLGAAATCIGAGAPAPADDVITSIAMATTLHASILALTAPSKLVVRSTRAYITTPTPRGHHAGGAHSTERRRANRRRRPRRAAWPRRRPGGRPPRPERRHRA